jgi:hypothetical protein
MPTAKWLDIIDNPTVADAIFDWHIHNMYRIEPEGDSMKKNTQVCPERNRRKNLFRFNTTTTLI